MDKREGDLATPAGDFPLLQGFYRSDRVAPPPHYAADALSSQTTPGSMIPPTPAITVWSNRPTPRTSSLFGATTRSMTSSS